ncbi:hypothetical protein [Tabrizicola flagellatus]|uniref:hypothetical protein n=1 Tax=Tabrizicola flagellatus TaxID=2593021 RepID=UPI0011F1E5D1|nr:hypothetical protein [Tabrizicola flagellatus]
MRIFLSLLVLAGPVAAQDWPRDVTTIVDEAKSICAGEFTADPGAVTQRDLNGDGTSDWVIDSGFFRCSDSHGTYCGTRGCGVDTLIDGTRAGLNLHSWDTVTEGGVTYLTAPNDKGETVRFLWTGSEWLLQ